MGGPLKEMLLYKNSIDNIEKRLYRGRKCFEAFLLHTFSLLGHS